MFSRAEVYRSSLALFFVASIVACGGEVSAPASESYTASFDRLWTTVDREYSNFPLKKVDWDSVYRAARPRAGAITSDRDFADFSAQVLSSLQDVHVWLVAPDGTARGTWTPAARSNWSPASLAQLKSDSAWRSEGAILGHTRVESIPYLVFQAWDAKSLSAAVVDRVIDAYRGAPAMIIDVRMNAGGDETLALQTAARFADRSRVVSHVQYRNGVRHSDYTPVASRTLAPRGAWRFDRPVVVLTGRGSFSATETFVSAMREYPNVVVVGDTTGGGSGKPAVFQLRNGWGVTLSRWIEYTARLEQIEGVGIAPDIAIPVTPSAIAAGRDETLAAAVLLARRVAAGR